MKIKDKFKIKDGVGGLSIKVIAGEKLDRLHIEHLPTSKKHPFVGNRDFWFTKEGEFDGTGSAIGS